ncbi:hypothetical protein [Phocaeicola sp.]|uniref:hypothetical protein n=1 Tax=Phocaeicola sp. TaxID=2773926 RepID=UPI0025990473|nr:hypothetical protein [uncultured Phocaeicola sp.]
MKDTIYSRRPGLIIGFHGCDKSVVDKVLSGDDILTTSTNDYDSVIEVAHGMNERAGFPPYDSVRSVFWEGDDYIPVQDSKKRTIYKYVSATRIA